MRRSTLTKVFNKLYEAGILVYAYKYDAITVERYRVELSPRLINKLGNGKNKNIKSNDLLT